MSENTLARLRSKIAGCGFTQSKIAARSGVSKASISLIASGINTNPRVKTADAIFRAIEELARAAR